MSTLWNLSALEVMILSMGQRKHNTKEWLGDLVSHKLDIGKKRKFSYEIQGGWAWADDVKIFPGSYWGVICVQLHSARAVLVLRPA